MKKLLRFLTVLLLAPCLSKVAHAQAPAPVIAPQSSNFKLGLDLMSDTKGADLRPYLKDLLVELRRQWLPLATAAVGQPLSRPEETLIGLTIAQDGHIAAVRLEGSTHNIPLDKAAWSATIASPSHPLPAELKGSNLKLRVHFEVNESPAG